MLHRCIGTKFALLVSLKFAYVQTKMCELSIYPKKIEFLCMHVYSQKLCVCVYTYVWNNVYTLSNCISLGPQRMQVRHNLYCYCFRSVVPRKLETFNFHFQHIYMHPFVCIISCANIVFCSEQFSFYGNSHLILLSESRTLSSLQPKTTFTGMMAASILNINFFQMNWRCSCGELWKGLLKACAVTLQTFEATSLLLARRTGYFFSSENLFLKVGAWTFFLVSGLSIYYLGKLILRIVASCLGQEPGICLCEWHDQNQTWHHSC